MPFIGYVEYRKRCVTANNGKCRVTSKDWIRRSSNRNNTVDRICASGFLLHNYSAYVLRDFYYIITVVEYLKYYFNYSAFLYRGHYSAFLLLDISGKNHVKFGHFVNFSGIFFGQKCLAPLKLTELLHLCNERNEPTNKDA